MPRRGSKDIARVGILALLAVGGGCLAFLGPGIREAEAARKRRPKAPPASAPATPAAGSPESLGPGLLFYEGFETGRLGAGWTGFAMRDRSSPPEKSGSLEIVTEPVRKGKHALKLIVRADDAVTDGDKRVDKERCELLRLNKCKGGSCSLGDEGREGADLWYAWSVLIPADYEYTSSDAKHYQIMGQWHDQPEPGRKPTGNSPPISVHYRSSGASQGFQVKYGLIQKGGPIKIFDAPIQKGKWVDLMFHIRFSRGSDGFLEVWKDGVQLQSESGETRITGPNMFNSQPNYLRLGLYRAKGQRQTNTFYYDEIRIGTTKDAVLGG